MDHTSLSNITKEEFEWNVEAAIQSLPGSEPQSPIVAHENQSPNYVQTEPQLPPSPHAGEESAQPLAMSTSTASINFGEDARKLLQKTGDAVSKPLSAIGRIFSEAFDGAENKLSNLPVPFAPSEPGQDHAEDQHSQEAPKTPAPAGSSAVPYDAPIQTPYKARVRKIPSHSQSPSFGSPYSPAASIDDTPSRGPRQWRGPMTNQPLVLGPSQPATPFHPPRHPPPPHGYPEHYMYSQTPSLPPRVQSLAASGGGLGPGDGAGDALHISRTPTPSLDFSGVQAEIDVAHANAAAAARETLMQIFPGTDVEVIELVLEANGGDLGKSIEGLLEMNNGG
ncbi:hypothetical protein AX14_009571 [Amanita brunnescens Koide BX004]|nr:hypothetical protein AX14_009571 [Amanita brunnescens Koide BX004]